MNNLGYERITPEELESGSRKTQWFGVACSLASIAWGGYQCWANPGAACAWSQGKSQAQTIATGLAGKVGKAISGASCIFLAAEILCDLGDCMG